MSEASEEAIGASDAGRAAVEHPPTRILVVEDDPRVLNQTMAALAELGHLPVACDHPSKAVKLLASHRDIGLFVSDVLMPDMTGPHIVRSHHAVYAHLPFLFVSGYPGYTAESADCDGHALLRN